MWWNLAFILAALYIIRRILFGNDPKEPHFGVYETKARWYYIKFILAFLTVQVSLRHIRTRDSSSIFRICFLRLVE